LFRSHFEERIERLIKDDILHPLNFLIYIIASIALKEKYVSMLRKEKPSEVWEF
jgi:hypothetical protein